MKINPKILAENLLFALLVFIAFLLVFGEKLVVPEWIQVIGRMHPMILHFPIVIILIAMLSELFSNKRMLGAVNFLKDISSSLLFSGAFFSALTVITGLLLSNEEGYAGNLLQLHKWTGISIAFLSSFVYWIKRYSWYKTPFTKINAAIIIIVILFTGHYGAGLTHGDNFVMEPLQSKEAQQATLEQALVFDHVIQPIFNGKCVSCHNPDKMKGELLLTDSASVLKGGKSGKLIVADNPEMSLLLQRIHLSENDEERMPPAGKSQLTAEELNILTLWATSDIVFSQKLIALPEDDSLRILASRQFIPEDKSEQYDFKAADEKTIEKLNTDYLVISSLAKRSPALAVNFYSRSAYKAKDLEQLNEIKDQIVSLNLSKMPVKDIELKQIGQFANLRHLNLNYTDITGSGLKELANLKYLKSISLSGTALTAASLSSITKLESIRSIYLWDTGMNEEQLAGLKSIHEQIQFMMGFKDDGKNPIKLNAPALVNKSSIFSEPVLAELSHPVRGVTIRYTLDGSEPDSVRSLLYKDPIPVQENTRISAKAFKSGWIGSEMAEYNFYKNTYTPDTIFLQSQPTPSYDADGALTLIDGKTGALHYRGSGDYWLGFIGNDLEVILVFKQPVLLSSVGLNAIFEPFTRVFPPSGVEIWTGMSAEDLKLTGTISSVGLKKGDKAFIAHMSKSFTPQKVRCLKVVARSVKKMPEWHPAKGKGALLLVDELFFN